MSSHWSRMGGQVEEAGRWSLDVKIFRAVQKWPKWPKWQALGHTEMHAWSGLCALDSQGRHLLLPEEGNSYLLWTFHTAWSDLALCPGLSVGASHRCEDTSPPVFLFHQLTLRSELIRVVFRTHAAFVLNCTDFLGSSGAAPARSTLRLQHGKSISYFCC